jgi:alpha-beta hydrolase superfamily lysophospholipase
MSDLRGWALAAAIVLAGCGDGEGGQGVVDEGEPPVPGCTDGTTSSGALTRVCFPAEWNGDLILYAHGYVQPDEPLAIPGDLIGGTPVEDLINASGYGYAATSYRANGLVADLAVDDLAQLKELVRRTVRPDPARIYIVGVSEGGLVAALAVEGPLDPYTGVLAACGPIGDFARQIDYFNDVRVVFDYFFPGVIPGSPIDPPDEVRAGWTATYAPAVATALANDPDAALELATVTGIPTEGTVPASLGEAVAGILWYNVLGTADAQQRLGGQPYDNEDRVYQGSSDDPALNAGVARFAADADARAELARFETSGDPAAPISIIHSTGDPIVPFFHQPLYADKVATAGGSELLDRQDVERFGHCAFTSSEILAAFGALPQ